MKSILVTGAAGFIGSQYIEHCNRAGLRVISVDRPEYFKTRSEHQSLDFGQIVDMDQLGNWLSENAQSVSEIVHLGACTDTTELNEDYLRRVNLDYSKMLWELASAKRIPLIYASSAATYGEGELGYDDREELIANLKPLNPYGESKRLFDLWALDQDRSGKCPPAWSGFKFFNVYGYGERHKGKMASVVMHAFDQIQSRGQVKLFKSHKAGIADGHQKRDFIFVEDVVSALEFARTKPLPRGIFNLGTGQARTFLDLVQAVYAALGIPEKIEFIDTPIELRERYQYFTQAETGRLRGVGFTQPFTSLEKGVQKYVNRLRG